MFVKFLGCVSKTMTFATGVKMKLVAKMGVFCHKLCEIKCNEKCVACFRIWRSFCEFTFCVENCEFVCEFLIVNGIA
jgi:hypothetical protein